MTKTTENSPEAAVEKPNEETKIDDDIPGKEEPEPKNIEKELRDLKLKEAELKKQQKEDIFKAEKVDIIEHKHCNICGRVFWNKDEQIKTCLICNPQRL